MYGPRVEWIDPKSPRPLLRRCRGCGGKGWVVIGGDGWPLYSKAVRCPACNGKGEVEVNR
jgi:DnaJ-class molecular chaperone